MKNIFLELVRGLIIGAGAILPGISGASLAVVFGAFEDFTALIAHPIAQIKPFFQKRYALCAGIGAGFIIFTLLLNNLFGAHTTALVFLFSGFIAGTLPGIFLKANKQGMGMAEIAAFCVTVGILIALSFLEKPAQAAPEALHWGSWILSGAIIAAGSLMPGISASFILIYLGLYEPLLHAVKTFDPASALLLGIGALLSLALLSHLIEALYKKFNSIMSFAVLGCTLGSVILVQGGVTGGMPLLPGIALLCAGFASSFFLDRLS